MKIGDMVLGDELGRGGMGVVLRGEHPVAGPVAVKVLQDPGPEARRLFWAEAEAVARLDHPHIVRVLDFGVVEGSPYLMMELLEGLDLVEAATRMGWGELRAMLVAILDGLAHAHARGVVHGDIKPSNLMSSRWGRWTLVDFGLAGLVHRVDRASGTLPYMAPEQLAAHAWDVGPWTDLYAVGAMTWQVCCGLVPRAGTREGLLATILAERLPPFTPRIPVPPGLAAWLEQLLAADPDDRFASCAAALHGLGGLGGPEGTTLARTALQPMETFTLDAPSLELEAAAPRAPLRSSRPPFPPHPGQPVVKRDLPPGLGAGLLALREVQLVGFHDQRVALWDRLARVVQGDAVPLTGVRGPPGSGRTALLSWLGRRASELGVAEVWHLTHGLARLAVAMLRLPEGDARSLRQRLAHADAMLREGLVGWLIDGNAAPARQAELLAALLRHRAERRLPQLLVLDPVPTDTVTIELLAHLVDVPGVWCLAAVDEALPVRGELLDLPPLQLPQLTELVHRRLGVDVDEARRVAREAGGSPGVALALLSDHGGPTADLAWVEGAEQALELAAVWGRALTDRMWTDLCDGAGLEPSPQVVSRGVRSGALARMPGGWRFVASTTRQALCDRAEAAGRRERWHRVCTARARQDGPSEQLADHLEALGERWEAAQVLLATALAFSQRGQDRDAAELCARGVALARAAGVSGLEADAWLGEALGWEAWSRYRMGQHARAASLADATVELGRRHRLDALIASGLHTGALARRAQGPAPDTADELRLAAHHYAQAGQGLFQVFALGTALVMFREHAELVDDLRALHADPDPEVSAAAAFNLARHCLGVGDCHGVVELLDPSSPRPHDLECLAAARSRMGEHDEARSLLHRALERLTGASLASRQQVVVQLAFVELAAGQHHAASTLLREHAWSGAATFAGLEAIQAAGLAVVCAHEGDGPGFDAAAARVLEGKPAVTFVEERRIDATLAEAEAMWRARGDEERAAMVTKLVAWISP